MEESDFVLVFCYPYGTSAMRSAAGYQITDVEGVLDVMKLERSNDFPLGWADERESYCALEAVTHWMPLPNPPDKE